MNEEDVLYLFKMIDNCLDYREFQLMTYWYKVYRTDRRNPQSCEEALVRAWDTLDHEPNALFGLNLERAPDFAYVEEEDEVDDNLP